MTIDPTTTRYRQRPLETEAIQWTGANPDQLRAFAGQDFDTIDPADRIEDPDQDAQLLIEASHWVGIQPGDWVLRFEGYFVAKADAAFRAAWETAAVPSAPADRPSELLRRSESYLSALHGSVGRHDNLAANLACAGCELRDQIAAELRRMAEERDERDAQANLDALVDLLPSMADEAQQPETGEPVKPTSRTWTFEVCYEGDKWHGCGGTYDNSVFDNAHETAQEAFQHRAENDKQRRRFRMIRATTTYAIEAEHAPVDEAQQPVEVDEMAASLRRDGFGNDEITTILATPLKQPETQAVCEGFQWIGQSFATCDRCGQPAWDHAGEEVPVEGAAPFDTRRTVRPWKPGEADAIRAKWAPREGRDGQDTTGDTGGQQ